MPATLDATGCNPTSNFTGNSLTDVPQQIHGQDDPGFIETEVREAAAAGLAGFAVNWAGTGSTTQTVTSNPYSKRLQILVDAVHKVNAEGIPFKLWLSYKSSASILSQSQIDADLGYFLSHYGNDPAFDRLRSNKVTIIWQGSRKYPISVLQAITPKYRSQARILGDETTWSADRGAYLDGNAYYWSSQDPYHNPQSFQQISALAAAVRGSGTQPGRVHQDLDRAAGPGLRQAARRRLQLRPAQRRADLAAAVPGQPGQQPGRLRPDQLERDHRGHLHRPDDPLRPAGPVDGRGDDQDQLLVPDLHLRGELPVADRGLHQRPGQELQRAASVGPTSTGHHHLPAAQPARQLADDARPHLRQRRRDDRRVHPAEASTSTGWSPCRPGPRWPVGAASTVR